MQSAVAPAPGANPNRSGGTGHRWWLLALLVVSICINYIDRGSVSVAAKGLSAELGLNAKDLGELFGAFFWTYAGFQMIAGWYIDRHDVYRSYAICFAAWSIATALTSAAGGFATIFGLRLALGAAESIAYPAYSKILAATFPEDERGRANAFIDAGSKLGPAFGLVIGGTIVAHYGWRAMFLALGVSSLLWLLPWRVVAPRNGGYERAHTGECPSILEIFSRRQAWGTFFGLFFANWAWYFMLTWLPQYFVRERRFSEQLMATYGSLPFWSVAIVATVAGVLSDRWISRGHSVTGVRKTFVVAGLAGCTVIAFAAVVKDPNVAMSLLVCSAASFGVFSSNHWAITQTLAGPRAAGKWTGIENTFGNVAGVLAPYVTGRIVYQTGSFHWAFLTTAGMLVLGALSFLLLIPRVEPVTWNTSTESLDRT